MVLGYSGITLLTFRIRGLGLIAFPIHLEIQAGTPADRQMLIASEKSGSWENCVDMTIELIKRKSCLTSPPRYSVPSDGFLF